MLRINQDKQLKELYFFLKRKARNAKIIKKTGFHKDPASPQSQFSSDDIIEVEDIKTVKGEIFIDHHSQVTREHDDGEEEEEEENDDDDDDDNDDDDDDDDDGSDQATSSEIVTDSDDEQDRDYKGNLKSDEAGAAHDVDHQDDCSDKDYSIRRKAASEIKKKKFKGSCGRGFIIDEAEVDDEIEEEDEWEDGAEDIDIIHSEYEEGPTSREIERHRRVSNIWKSRQEDKLEEYLKNKYAAKPTKVSHDGETEEVLDEISQKALLPGIKDPSLWMVKCKIGEEKETLLHMMRKFITLQNTDGAIQIKSVIVPAYAKGYIYVEAYKQPLVKQAIENIGTLKMGLWNQQLVPIEEMTDVLKVVKNQKGLKAKQWVRIQRGQYKDDIAQVDYVDLPQKQVLLKLIPRIDYLRFRGALRSNQSNSESSKRKVKLRPPAKLFDPEAIRAIGGEITSDGDFLVFEGNRYSRKGFLYKNFNINAVTNEDIKPTLPELENFEETLGDVIINIDPPHTTKKDENFVHNFSTGDNVIVCEGELKNLEGKIVAIDGPSITIVPNHKQLKDPIIFPVSDLKKFFKQGDHVKVISGRFQDDTGLIVCVEDNRVVLFSDLTMHELEVLPKDVQICSEMASGVDSHGQFQWGECVQIDPQTVGVIVRMEWEKFHILSMHDKVIQVKRQAIQKRRESHKAVALDSEQNPVQKKDIVKVVDGPHAGRDGEIKHIYRNYAFLYSRVYLINGGIFVCKTRHLLLAGGMKARKMLWGGISTPQISSPQLTSSFHPLDTKNADSKGSRVTSDKEIVGHTVKITVGPFKSNVGIVKEATESTVRVELHTSCQTITVDRSHVTSIYHTVKSGSTRTTPLYGSGNQTPSKTPVHGPQTPMYDAGSRTPHYGSITPLHDGSRTPGQTGAWDPSITNTPARSFSSSSDFDYSPAEPLPVTFTQCVPVFPAGMQAVNAMYRTDAGSSFSSSQHSPSPCVFNAVPSMTPSPISFASSPDAISIYGTPSPYIFSPMTPGGVLSPLYPHVTGVLFDQFSASQQDWHTTDIEVHIKAGDPGLIGQTGVVRGISGNMGSIFLPDEDRVVNINLDYLEPVVPQRNDMVKVILGDDREAVGKLLSIDNQEGVVKLNSGELKMLQLRYLCRMKPVKQD